MTKLIRNLILFLIFIIIVFYSWDYLSPGMPKSFNECIEKGGTPGKIISEKGVENDLNKCVFAAKNGKQERECTQMGGKMRTGGACPCCEMTYQKR